MKKHSDESADKKLIGQELSKRGLSKKSAKMGKDCKMGKR